MSPQPRKSLDDLAARFVYGSESQAADQPDISEAIAEPETVINQPQPAPDKLGIIDKLQQAKVKEKTVRLTVDLSESMHRKLSILAARTGKKKAEIVRFLLDEVLGDEAE